MCSVAILQSNYIPWKGYFDLINSVDKFIIYDDVQYTKGDWRNRNKIQTASGPQWLTIPVIAKFGQKINETKIHRSFWAKKHLHSIENNYHKAKNFKQVFPWIEEIYLKAEKLEFLSEVNFLFVKEICKKLGIKTELIDSRNFIIEGSKSNALLSIMKQIDGVSNYLSGPAARIYLDENLFNDEKIIVNWMDYSGYRTYNQLHSPFEHNVSILDLILNESENFPLYMKSFTLK